MGPTTSHNVLVTGAAGLVGSHAVKALYENGYSVTALYRKLDHEKVPWDVIHGDLLEKDTIRRLGSVKCDSIVHCAAVLPSQFHGDEAERAAHANTLIDRGVVGLCADEDLRLIYASSSSVYGFCSGSLLTEDHDISPIGPYAAAKAESERKMLGELKESSVILRLSAPYGPGQRTRTVLRLFIERALTNLDLMYYGSGERTQDFTSASDIGNVICCAVSNVDANGIFNIASGKPISMRDLAKLVIRTIAGTRSRTVPSGQPDPQEDYRAAFDISRAQRLLGWHPIVSLEEGIRQWAQCLKRDVTEL